MPSTSPDSQTILFLASNPDGLLRVGSELRDIKEGLRRSQHRDQHTLSPCLDVRVKEIQRSLLDDPPHIVHFAGNGQGEKGLLFEDITGNSKVVSVAALAGLFALFADDEVTSFTGEGAFCCCSMAPDGHIIIAGDTAGTLYFIRFEGTYFSDTGKCNPR